MRKIVQLSAQRRARQLRAVIPAFALPLLALGACKKSEEEPPPAQPGQPPPGTYNPQQQQPPPGYQQQPQPGYGQPTQPAPAQPAPAQPAPAQPAPGQPAPAPTTSQPAAIAFPCQTDATCLSHKCDTAVGKCVWPCQTNNDCQAGFQCTPPACIPATQ